MKPVILAFEDARKHLTVMGCDGPVRLVEGLNHAIPCVMMDRLAKRSSRSFARMNSETACPPRA